MKLDLLAPAELTRALARVYVYNMNSTFRQVPPARIIPLSARTQLTRGLVVS